MWRLKELRTLGRAEQRVLNRIAINPHLRQAAIADELNVTRSAINQVWQRLEDKFDLQIKGNINYGQLGLHYIFGWAQSSQGDKNLDKFWTWLQTYPYTSQAIKSALTSAMDMRIYFEVFLPAGGNYNWFTNQLRRFEKKPYNITIFTESVIDVSNYLNIGLFDGKSWDFDYDFQMEASIDAAKEYADVFPVNAHIQQIDVDEIDWRHIAAASLVESNYYASSTKLAEMLRQKGMEVPSKRTLRRRLSYVRNNLAVPYVTLSNLGLEQEIIVCVRELSQERLLSRLLHTRGRSFPKTRVISGPQLAIMRMQIPEDFDWISFSKSFSALGQNTNSIICTFITSRKESRNGLEAILSKNA